MAGFADVIRNGVAIADSITATLQTTVTHYLWSQATKDAYRKVTWGSGIVRRCVVEKTSRLVRNDQGDLVQATAIVTFPRPTTVDVRDRIVLSDGTEGPIIKITGVVDPDTASVYALELFLGQ